MQIKTIRYHLSPIRMAIIKKMTITNVGEDTEKGDTRALLVGMSIAAATMKNSMDFGKCSPPKLKIELSHSPAIPFLGIFLTKDKHQF